MQYFNSIQPTYVFQQILLPYHSRLPTIQDIIHTSGIALGLLMDVISFYVSLQINKFLSAIGLYSIAYTLINRKGFISTNVLGAVDIDGRFVYTFAGWEGSAADSRVLSDALSKDFVIPTGKYFLADAGTAVLNFTDSRLCAFFTVSHSISWRAVSSQRMGTNTKCKTYDIQRIVQSTSFFFTQCY